jgi:hypothetical protein
MDTQDAAAGEDAVEAAPAVAVDAGTVQAAVVGVAVAVMTETATAATTTHETACVVDVVPCGDPPDSASKNPAATFCDTPPRIWQIRLELRSLPDGARRQTLLGITDF